MWQQSSVLLDDSTSQCVEFYFVVQFFTNKNRKTHYTAALRYPIIALITRSDRPRSLGNSIFAK